MADEAAAIEQVRAALSPLDNKMRSRVIQWASSWVLDHGGGLFGVPDGVEAVTSCRELVGLLDALHGVELPESVKPAHRAALIAIGR